MAARTGQEGLRKPVGMTNSRTVKAPRNLSKIDIRLARAGLLKPATILSVESSLLLQF
jgi:hypothetical protein